jgi:hypothetical protein
MFHVRATGNRLAAARAADHAKMRKNICVKHFSSKTKFTLVDLGDKMK